LGVNVRRALLSSSELQLSTADSKPTAMVSPVHAVSRDMRTAG
jgi:hypothetical protein